jgi:hypothetical protein
MPIPIWFQGVWAPTLWTKSVTAGKDTPPERPLDQVEQRWFVGAHADDGGGYSNGLLAQEPLRWLMSKAQMHGLHFKNSVELDGDENKGRIHDSFRDMAGGSYRALKLFRPFYRKIGAEPIVERDTTTTNIGETIDGSVFDRWRADQRYRPANLAEWESVTVSRRIPVTAIREAIARVGNCDRK